MNTLEFLSYLRRLDVKLFADGAQLRCNAPKGVLTPALSAEIAGRKAEILAFLRQANLAASSTLSPISRVSRGEDLPLSLPQSRLWFLEQLAPGSPAYNIPAAYRVTGRLNAAALEKSLIEIVRRHESLRTTFPAVNGRPKQVISPTVDLTLRSDDLRKLPELERKAQVQRRAIEEARRPFDLARGPLLRVKLLRLAEEEHVLFLTVHHIVFDVWSVGVLRRELAALYEAFSKGKPSPLPELPIQYADFAHWQRQQRQGEVLESQLAYWKRRLNGLPSGLELPTDRPRPAVQTFRGAYQSLVLPASLSRSLKALSQEEEATLFMTLLAAFQTLLYRYTGQEDIVVGSPIANRTRAELEGLIGFFVNTLALRTNLSGNPGFRELLGRVREVALEAYAHQDTPFEKLVEELQPERDLSRTPLFQVIFALQNVPTKTLELEGLTLSSLGLHSGTAKFDLSFYIEEGDDGLSTVLEYNTDLFDASTIQRMLGHYQRLLEGVVENPNARLSDLPLLTEAERRQLLVEWNNTQTNYPKDWCIHEAFEEQAERTPEAIAVVYGDQQLTYRQLNARANQLAHYLQKLGVGPDVLVGVWVERSVELVVGVLGILKAGGAYVPLDATSPRERLALMLADAQPKALLTQQRLAEDGDWGLGKVMQNAECRTQNESRGTGYGAPGYGEEGFPLTPNWNVVRLDADWEAIAQESEANPVSGATAQNLAYAIYTSGSTGRPKGVAIPHQGLLNLAFWHQRAFGVTSNDRATQLAAVSFDASVWEIWPYLTAGARLHLTPPSIVISPVELRDWLTSQAITISFLPTPLAERALMLDWPKDAAPSASLGTRLRILLTGGDKLHQPPSESIPFEVVNNYGPTENTVVTTSGRVFSDSPGEGSAPPIGRPISNVQVYLLDAHLNPVPIGIPGELCIGGDSLARGYLNSPELTALKFIPNPFSDAPGARLYKTGDVARYLPDGNIEFVGRIDHQVKIRGFRIELGEIEAALKKHPAVEETVVIVREDAPGDKRLVAYIVLVRSSEFLPRTPYPGFAPAVFEWRRFLLERLPEYMVPSAFVFLDALPLTPNGKVDRRALPAPEQMASESEKPFAAPPTNPVEKTLAGLWSDLLGVESVGIHDDFFELGGHSLLATQLMSRVRDAFQVETPLFHLFETPTVAGLARRIQAILWALQGTQPSSSDTADDREEGEI
jgi:aspartate racemase